MDGAWRLAILVLLAFVLVAAPGAARAQGVDHWWSGFGLQGVEPHLPGQPSNVSAMVVYRGRLVVAGSFGQAGRVSCSNIATWDGRRWSPLASATGEGVNNTTGSAMVLALTVYNGDLIAAGRFETAGGVAASNIARWDGSNWWPLGTGVTGSYIPTLPSVKTLVVYQGRLFAGGHFRQAGGVVAESIAAWDGVARVWQAVGAGFVWQRPDLTEVHALTPYGGELVAAGIFGFQQASGAAANHIAAWNGTSWHALGAGMNNAVHGVADDGHGGLIVGGLFTSPARYVARWDGAAWQAVATGAVPTGAVQSVAATGGVVVACSRLPGAPPTQDYRVTQWDGATWTALGTAMDEPAWAFATLSNGTLVAAGSFTTVTTAAGLRTTERIATWDGLHWNPLSGGMNGAVLALATNLRGDLVAGGSFTQGGPVHADHIARWDGTLWNGLGAGVNGAVRGLLSSGADLIAGGDFTALADATPGFAHVGRWDGTAWHPMGPGLDGSVHALVSDPGLGVVAAGAFTGGVAAWNGSAWQVVGSGLAGVVDALVVDPTLGLLAGGDLLAADGITPVYLARWDTVSLSWVAMDTGLDGPVHALHAMATGDLAGQLFAGGGFTGLVARWGGASWTPLNLAATGTVLALDGIGTLVVGGSFVSVENGGASTNLASWDGQVWASGSYGSGLNATVDTLTLVNTSIVAGGHFTEAPNPPPAPTLSTDYIARHVDCPFDPQADFDGDGVCGNLDNCQLAYNPDQRDTNGDLYGNVCDPDLNDDGVVNFGDLLLLANVFFTGDPNADFDGDGVVNFGDLLTMAQLFLQAPGPSAFHPVP